jgi:ABC-type dipeptide/oligopeptide/nickel transport system permease subunit
MLAEAATRLDLRYLLYAPSLALLLTVAAFTVVGSALGDAVGIRRMTSDV